MTDDVDLLIRKIEARDQVSAEERQALAAILGPPARHARGKVLIHPGDRPADSTLLVQGLCARFSLTRDGQRQITELHVAGDFVDLHSFLLKTMDHGVLALSPCTTLPARHSALKEITEQRPHLTRLLWLSTLIDAAIHRQWLVNMGRRDARGRFAHLLCETYVRLQIVGLASGGTFELPLTQSQMADALGLTVVHVNRTLRDLRSDNAVEWTRGRVVIQDFERLAAIADFDPAYLRLSREPI